MRAIFVHISRRLSVSKDVRRKSCRLSARFSARSPIMQRAITDAQPLVDLCFCQIAHHATRDHWRTAIGRPVFLPDCPSCNAWSLTHSHWSTCVSARLSIIQRAITDAQPLVDLCLFIQISSAPICRVWCHASWNLNESLGVSSNRLPHTEMYTLASGCKW